MAVPRVSGGEAGGLAGMMASRALEWAYDRVASRLPGLGNAEELARTYLRRADGDAERAIDSLVRWHVAYAGTSGFASNLGGLVTLPIGLPANLSSVLLIQLRMVAAIAHLRGHSIADPEVKTLAFICLTGSAGAGLLQDLGIRLGTRLTTRMMARLSTDMLARLNQTVALRLAARVGTAGLANLSRLVPILGGVVGAGFDAAVTRGIAEAAKRVFAPVPSDEVAAEPSGR